MAACRATRSCRTWRRWRSASCARPRSTTATRSRATTRRCTRRAPTAAAWSRRTTAASPARSRRALTGRLRVQHHQDPGRPQLRDRRGRSLSARQEDRPARGLPLQGGLAVLGRVAAGVRRRDRQLEARVRLRRGGAPCAGGRRAGRLQRRRPRSARAPSARAASSSTAPATSASTPPGRTQTCDFKSGKIILQQPVAHEQMNKLLSSGRTDLLDNFVSNKTRRKFKAYLEFDPQQGKVVFEFEPRPQRGGKGAPAKGGSGRSERRRRTGEAGGQEGRREEGGCRRTRSARASARQEDGGEEVGGQEDRRAQERQGLTGAEPRAAPCRGSCCRSCWRCSSSSASAGGPAASAGSAKATPRACSATRRS